LAKGKLIMDSIQKLFLNNKKWAESMEIKYPGFFGKLSKQQSPEFLWIGCSDSRVPANEIVGLLPGELFVHRNVANLVIHTDINCLSVIQFAVDILKVKHVIVCGHYGCGGIITAMKNNRNGLIDNWLRNIQDVYRVNADELNQIADTNKRADRLSELNVIRQVFNIADSTIIREAWGREQEVDIHGWIYGISNGILKDLNCSLNSKSESRQKGYLSQS
jgi:carbonic anhydrase